MSSQQVSASGDDGDLPANVHPDAAAVVVPPTASYEIVFNLVCIIPIIDTIRHSVETFEIVNTSNMYFVSLSSTPPWNLRQVGLETFTSIVNVANNNMLSVFITALNSIVFRFVAITHTGKRISSAIISFFECFLSSCPGEPVNVRFIYRGGVSFTNARAQPGVARRWADINLETVYSGQQPRPCRDCNTEPGNVFLLPCGHRVMCVQCAAMRDNCPRCGVEIFGEFWFQ